MNNSIMEDIRHYIKRDFIGYAVVVGLFLLIIKVHLLPLCLFFLFIHLACDIFVNGIGSRYPRMSKRILLWLFYVVFISSIVAFSILVVPHLLSDLVKYLSGIQDNTVLFLSQVSTQFDIVFDMGIIKKYLLIEGSKSVGKIISVLNIVSKSTLYFLFAITLNLLIFLEKQRIRETFTSAPGSLMSYIFVFVIDRVQVFYNYFKRVMVGQILISMINTALTTVLLISLDIPNKISLVFLVFIFGIFS
jgi:predicted PurR-regulated permease PerM